MNTVGVKFLEKGLLKLRFSSGNIIKGIYKRFQGEWKIEIILEGKCRPCDYCYLVGIIESPKNVDIIFISVKIELISRVSLLARSLRFSL